MQARCLLKKQSLELRAQKYPVADTLYFSMLGTICAARLGLYGARHRSTWISDCR